MSESPRIPPDLPLRLISERPPERALLSQYKDLNEAIHRMHWQLDDLERELRELAKSNHLYRHHRQADLNRWKTALEDRLLNAMCAADDLAVALGLKAVL